MRRADFIRFLAALLCAALIGGSPDAARAGGCQLSLAASLPLIPASGGRKLLVDVTVDGSPVRLIVDTGSEGLMLTEAAAQRASKAIAIGSLIGGGNEIDSGFAMGIGGAREVSRLPSLQLGIGRMHGAFSALVTNETFALGDMNADGLLGMSLLGDFDLDFDMIGRQLRLYSTKGACGQPAVALDEPVYAAALSSGYHDQLRIMVPVVIDGQSFKAVLDTGSPGILIFAHTARQLGLQGAAGQRVGVELTGVGGQRAAVLQRLGAIAIGPITLKNVVAAVDSEDFNGADLLLGLDFLRQVHVWVSHSSHMLVMQYPPAASPALQLGP